MLEATIPLFLPFYICLTRYGGSYRQFALVGGIIGALLIGPGNLVIIIMEIVLVHLLLKTKFLHERYFLSIVFSVAITQICWQLVYYQFQIPTLIQLYVVYEIAVSGVLFIFFKNLLIDREKLLLEWGYERIVSAIVIFSLLLVALQSVQVFNISPATVLLQLAICTTAFYGPIALPAFLATLAGATISMAQLSFTSMIALYALTGAFVGNAKRLGKYGIALLSLVPSIIFFFYDDTLPLDIVHFTSIAIGAFLFLQLTNFIKFEQPIKKQVAVVDQSVYDFQRFTTFLHEMVDISLSQLGQQKVELSNFSSCEGCYRYERCWSDDFMNIRLKDILLARQQGKKHAQMKAEQSIQDACVRSTHLLNELQYRMHNFQLANQQYYSRKLIGQQLKEMGEQFNWLLQQSAHNVEKIEDVEERLFDHLHSIRCMSVRIEKMRLGYVNGHLNVAEQINENELTKRLTQFFKEPMELYERVQETGVVNTIKYRFRSAIRYEMEYDIYNKKKASTTGDYIVVTELERGLNAVLVADGMGSGELAQQQSRQLLFLLKQCLQYQLSAELALSTLQYLLNPIVDDSYATLDMLLFDLKKGELSLWKTGSIATYIIRGDQMIVIESRSAPIGTLQTITKPEKVQLMAGDYIFILTDGMFQSERFDEQEELLKHLLVQRIGYKWSLSTLLYDVMESYKARFSVEDDVTFVAVKVEHTSASWAKVNL